MGKGKGFIGEFKTFATKGNVMDLAVGVIIGGAFSSITTSLVNDVIMPVVSMFLGGIDFTYLSLTFRDATIHYGNFLQNVLNFLIVAFCIFIVVKFMNRMHDKNKSLLEKAREKATVKLSKKEK